MNERIEEYKTIEVKKTSEAEFYLDIVIVYNDANDTSVYKFGVYREEILVKLFTEINEAFNFFFNQK